MLLLFFMGPFGHNQIHLKRSPKVHKCTAQCLSLEKTPNQIIKPILLEETIQNNQKTDFHAVFGHFGAPLNRPQKIHEGLQVGAMLWPTVSV
jgi:hypothetical protein